jgi:hypothetical protein
MLTLTTSRQDGILYVPSRHAVAPGALAVAVRSCSRILASLPKAGMGFKSDSSLRGRLRLGELRVQLAAAAW